MYCEFSIGVPVVAWQPILNDVTLVLITLPESVSHTFKPIARMGTINPTPTCSTARIKPHRLSVPGTFQELETNPAPGVGEDRLPSTSSWRDSHSRPAARTTRPRELEKTPPLVLCTAPRRDIKPPRPSVRHSQVRVELASPPARCSPGTTRAARAASGTGQRQTRHWSHPAMLVP